MWQSIPVCNTNTPEDQELKVILDMQQVGDQPELQVTISERGGVGGREGERKEKKDKRIEEKEKYAIWCASALQPQPSGGQVLKTVL